tara:strand:+ start:96 stop:911 length:816 start_codon:yes stop_codon:yes gene_type:complete
MSSIYKKGRDGYYYYQTYVFDKKTGKKNKKIFHSLGTKNEFEAKEKQKHLDSKYGKKNENISFTIVEKFKSIGKTGSLIILTVVTTIFFSEAFKTTDNSNDEINILSLNDKIKNAQMNQPDKILTDENNGKVVSNEVTSQNNEIHDSTVNTKTENIVTDHELIMPSYTIRRIDQISGAFKQAKMFVTIKDFQDKNIGLRMLCDTLTKKHSQFSNIVICVYKETVSGINIAMGEEYNLSDDKHRDAWLAMYTFNPVEGPYFDDNPGRYLRGN